MAGETILVVEDAAISLKLTAAILRAEGYKVHIASTGEQALSTLRFMRPDLILADLMLPGMSGLELAARIRLDSRLSGCLVIALTACVVEGDEQRAREAGCDGYIPKPIEPADLVAKTRQYLEHGGEPETAEPVAEPEPVPLAAAPDPEPAADLLTQLLPEAEMEDLRRSFVTDGAEQSHQLLSSLETGFDAVKAARTVHQWSGTGGLLGLPEVSRQARDAEIGLRSSPLNRERLRACLMNLVREFEGAGNHHPALQIPSCIVEQLTRKRVALVGFAEKEAERLCAACEMAGAKARLFQADDPAGAPILDCNVVLIHVRAETLSSRWLGADFVPLAEPPVIFAGNRKQLYGLETEVQSRASEFLIDGWQPEEALMRISFALSRTAAAVAARKPSLVPATAVEPADPIIAEVLVADDDSTVRALVNATLQQYGFRCHLAATGSEALTLIRRQRPHAVLLDVNMPVIDGFEVLTTVRAEKIPTRVIMLTAREQEKDVLLGFSLGADDYVVKPFSPLQLVARLKRALGYTPAR